MDAPDMTGDDSDVSVARDELTVRPERRRDSDDRPDDRRRTDAGTTRATAQVSDVLDADRPGADVPDGVLVSTVPIAEPGRKRTMAESGGRSGAEADETRTGH